MPRKQSDPIHEELMRWLHMDFSEREKAENREGFHRFWNECFAGNELAKRPVDDAGVAALGFADILLDGADNQAGLAHFDHFLHHPRIDDADYVHLVTARTFRMERLLDLAQIEEAIKEGKKLLDWERPYRQRLAAVHLRCSLAAYAFMQDPNAPAPAGLIEVAWKAARAMYKRVHRESSHQGRFGEIIDAFLQTIHPSEQEDWLRHVKRLAERRQERGRRESEP